MDDATHFLAANNVTCLANRLLDEDDEAARAHWRRLLLVEVNKFGQPAERLARVELQIAAADRRLGRLRRLTGAATGGAAEQARIELRSQHILESRQLLQEVARDLAARLGAREGSATRRLRRSTRSSPPPGVAGLA